MNWYISVLAMEIRSSIFLALDMYSLCIATYGGSGYLCTLTMSAQDLLNTYNTYK